MTHARGGGGDRKKKHAAGSKMVATATGCAAGMTRILPTLAPAAPILFPGERFPLVRTVCTVTVVKDRLVCTRRRRRRRTLFVGRRANSVPNRFPRVERENRHSLYGGLVALIAYR